MNEMVNEGTDMNNNSQIAQGVDEKRRHRKIGGWWWPTLAVLGLVVVLVTGVRSANRLGKADRMPRDAANGSAALAGAGAHVPVVSEADRALVAARIRAARRAAAVAYRTSVEAEYEAFKRRVAERSSAFDVVRADIPGTVGKYGFKKCWSVMYALAKDKVAKKFGKGCTTNFDQLMNGDLREGFYQPLQDARGEVLMLLNELQVRLQSCRDELDRNMAGIPEWDRSLGEPPASLKAESLRIDEMLTALREVQIGATVSAAIDAACVAGVCQTVVRLLAGAVGRLAGGMAAGAVTSQLDSPAPGPADLVALGICAVSVAATAWEVRKAAKIVPERLAKAMNEAVDAQCAEVRRRTLDEGEKLYLSYVRTAAFASAEGEE